MPRKMPILESAEGMASRPAPRTVSHQSTWSRASLVGEQVLVLTRLITLDIHVAWPWCPLCVLPLPRLSSRQHIVLCPHSKVSYLRPRSEPVLEAMESISFGSGPMAAYPAMLAPEPASTRMAQTCELFGWLRYVCDATRRAARGCEYRGCEIKDLVDGGARADECTGPRVGLLR